MKLENETCIVTFDDAGGEIASFIRKDTNIEYMYKGDGVWAGKNPTLFPIVGNTFSKSYTIDGKTYEMKNHGLIRYATLLGHRQDDSVVFTLRADEETKKQYPFDFLYEIQYSLEGSTLNVAYTITNEGHQPMPFTFGLHPGFKCPIRDGETFEDYTFHFDKEESCEQFSYASKEYEPVHVKDISMSYDLFEENPTLIYKGIASTIFEMNGPSNQVRIEMGDEVHYPIMALWTPQKDAGFLCIEPWLATGDLTENDQPFDKREGTILLDSKENFKTSYKITIS